MKLICRKSEDMDDCFVIELADQIDALIAELEKQ